MTLSVRIKIAILALLGAMLVTVGPAWIGYQVAHGEDYDFVISADSMITEVPGTRVRVEADNGDSTTIVGAVAVEIDGKPVRLAQLDSGSGSATAISSPATAAPATPATATPQAPQASDVGVVTKLWKNGSFFGVGILALYLALFVWWKVDKKRAFYSATALGGVMVLVESIRRGDTPSATMALSTVLPTIGILITGPNHTKAPAPGT